MRETAMVIGVAVLLLAMAYCHAKIETTRYQNGICEDVWGGEFRCK